MTVQDASTADPQSLLQGKRALICEDEGVIQIQITRALKLAGMEVVGGATNGKEGVEQALLEKPDLVLMDLNMPVIDGMEAARRILADCPTTCVVMLTAYGDSDFRKRAREIGACGYIVKPITADTLLPQLEEAYTNYLARTANPST